ncbi:MAG: agmatine deiminase family protein, partial [Bacteroidales bacterium]|nr:agmatine deiminase family protein [Bacteroidales bacterium]
PIYIDCWGKFLDVDKILIREVPPTHAQYSEIEATAAYYAAQTTSYGVPFEVYRVYTPDDQPYTNSIILNEKVLVPVTGSQWDDEALQSYEQAMPGYEVIGLTGSWQSTDALHCRSKGIADIGMLYIHHIPILGNAPVLPSYQIDASITAHSGQTIYNDSVFIYYSVDGGAYTQLQMTHVSGKNYTGNIPGQMQGALISYYIYAADASGRRETHPFIGEPDPHVFFVGQPLYPDISVQPSEINATCVAGGATNELLTILNNGQYTLNYQISCDVLVTEEFNYSVLNSPAQNAWDYNTYTELNWTDYQVNETGPVAGWEITYTWNTDNWAYEGSFHVESPSGTSAIIASGTNDGTYTITLNDFNGEDMAGNWKIWIQDTYGDGGHQATNITMKITRSLPVASWLSVNPTNGNVNPTEQQNVTVTCDASALTEGMYEGNLTISSDDPNTPEIIVPVHFNVTSGYSVDIRVFLEGPYFTPEMHNYLNLYGLVPLSQPYNTAPWNYFGSESVVSIPNPDIIDWLLVEFRDAPNAASANGSTIIKRVAAFLLKNGNIRDLDGSSLLTFNESVNNNLFAVIIHRNHLGVISAFPLNLSGNQYSYDFTTGSEQAHGGILAQHEVFSGVWAMIGGDSDADGQVTNGDKLDVWASQAGMSGYLSGDMNMDSGVNNGDKNDVWVPNGGLGSQVPQ